MMFGFACDETEELMPLPISLAHALCRRLSAVRKEKVLGRDGDYLRPDGKAQVTVEYDGSTPIRVHTVVVSTQHGPEIPPERLRLDIEEVVIRSVIPEGMLDERTRILVNPTGRFVVGGPQGDSGLTGRKIIVDTYGGYARHGGGAFSGKDPTKVDRSAAYAARHAAKNLVAAGLAAEGISVYCVHGVSQAEYETHLEAALSCRPNLVLDDGGDLARRLHSDMRDLAQDVYGATEETTTGVRRLRALARDGGLLYPVVAVNDARSKNLFDNRFGTGQSVVTAVMNTSNRMFGGSTVVVAGYGMCGKGVALRSRGLGADVVVCEVDPIKAAEAIMDGYRVMTMDDAAHVGDIFITVTGCRDVIRTWHYAAMKDNVLLANAGHFDVEINVGELAAAATESWQVRPGMVGYKMRDGRVLCLLAEGRLVNLAAGDGHPIEIMDMSFSLQAECLRYIAESRGSLPVGVLHVPDSIDRYVAERLLDARTARIDRLTAEQAGYLDSFGMGE